MMIEDEPVDIADPREYAWLLERSDTFAASLVEVWHSVPIGKGSWLGMAFGYPTRLLLLGITIAIAGVASLAMILAAAVAPVAVFAVAEPWLPPLVWLVLLGAVGAGMVLYLGLALTAHLQLAARGDAATAGMSGLLREGIVARPVSGEAGWQSWDTVHISHPWARRRLFAAGLLVVGLVLQCLSVVLGEGWFDGPVESAWSWAAFYAGSLFDTALLGIPSALVPPWSAIDPRGIHGDLLVVAVDLCFAAGLITLVASTLGSALRIRELFNGTTRDLADFLHEGDVSGGAAVTIHRVAVVRPLDPTSVVSLTKAEFFERVSGS